jgi:hypothetical protein
MSQKFFMYSDSRQGAFSCRQEGMDIFDIAYGKHNNFL